MSAEEATWGVPAEAQALIETHWLPHTASPVSYPQLLRTPICASIQATVSCCLRAKKPLLRRV